MTTIDYALERTPREYERLRAQARMWEAATARLLDGIGIAPGARCLDAGCGPGETMRLMADRAGPQGRVVGLDVDARLVPVTERALGLPQCRVLVHDVTADEPIPGGPFDLVYARLLLFHLPSRVAVLRRLWEAVAPGGHLVIQDYDLSVATVVPVLPGVGELARVLRGGFEAIGCDVQAGTRMPALMIEAGIGTPAGTDVSGHLEPLASGRMMLEQTFRSVLPAALAHGVTTEEKAEETLAMLDEEAMRYPDRPLLWPLMCGTWARREPAGA
nr:class I SAM-dependent methyltransferase [uncultured Actinoplanes sp.]